MELLSQPGTRRVANVPPLTQKQLRDADRDTVFIFNVSPRRHSIPGPDRMYVIPGRKLGQEVSEALVIPGAIFPLNIKKVVGIQNEYERTQIDGIDLAEDILGLAPFKDQSENLVRWGCFYSMSPVPSEDEIASAREQWHTRCDEIIRDADNLFAVNRGMVKAENGRDVYGIGKDALEAASEIGVDREWTQRNTKQVICDECGTSNMPTAAFCKVATCDNLLNAEAAQRKFPAKYADRMGLTEEKRGPGRPPKVV